jgi:hypothetical protein
MNNNTQKALSLIQSFITQDRVEKLTGREIERLAQFRAGQLDRARSAGCLSANGDYLDGWYSPEKELPPFLVISQSE